MINLQRYRKMIFLTSLLILIGLLSFPSTAMAKASKQLESLIKQRKWDEVSHIATPGGDATLYHQVYILRRFLNSRDNCIENPTLPCFNSTITQWKKLVKDLTKKRRFSKEFYHYLDRQKETLKAKFSQTAKELSAAVKADRRQCKELENALPPIPSSIALEEVFDCYAKVWAESEKRYVYDFGGRRKSPFQSLDMSPEMFKLSKRITETKRIEWARQEKRKEEKRIKKQEEARIKKEKKKKEKKRKEEKAFKIVSNKAAKLGYKQVRKVGIARFGCANLKMISEKGM